MRCHIRPMGTSPAGFRSWQRGPGSGRHVSAGQKYSSICAGPLSPGAIAQVAKLTMTIGSTSSINSPVGPQGLRSRANSVPVITMPHRTSRRVIMFPLQPARSQETSPPRSRPFPAANRGILTGPDRQAKAPSIRPVRCRAIRANHGPLPTGDRARKHTTCRAAHAWHRHCWSGRTPPRPSMARANRFRMSSFFSV